MGEHTPGPWRWQGEDYRDGWGWMMLVGPKGQGLIVGQDEGGGPCRELRAHMPVDPALCVTGMMADGKPHVEPVHVFGDANARLIAAAPDLLEFAQYVADMDEDNPAPLFTRARAAIAKATGEVHHD